MATLCSDKRHDLACETLQFQALQQAQLRKSGKNSRLTLRVPDELYRALERQSTALGISKSDLAREALKRYLRVAEFRTLRTKLVARAQAGGINTDEDVFEALKKT